MAQDIIRSSISAFRRIKRLACRLLRAGGHDADYAERSERVRQARRRLARQRSSDARAIGLARRDAGRRSGRESPAICSVPSSGDARATLSQPRPQLDGAVIGRHFRLVFPAAPANGLFDDLLARLEAAERRHAGPPMSPGGPNMVLACAS
jgi:hypothetical protein